MVWTGRAPATGVNRMPGNNPINGHVINNAGAPRVAIYVRFSSENQSYASNDDQIRECRQFAVRNGWMVVDEYIFADEAKTGQTVVGRGSLDNLLRLAQQKPRPFDFLLFYHTSRLGRDVGDVHKLKATFKFFGITLIFVADGLDSRAAGFDMMFGWKSLGDQQYSVDLAAHIRKGQIGRFEARRVAGGGTPFGYCRVPHENVNKRGLYGRFEVEYVEWAIDPERAKVIKFIFEAYASGYSYADIAKLLNERGVKPPQAARLRTVASWSKSALQVILRNDKYIGILRWNQSYQERNPLTGKMETRSRPESEWLVREMPDLRIVPQDLWDRVCEQRRIRSTSAKQLGGMARTSKARTYLLSGRLLCGVCGHKMFIVSTNPPRYGCADYRQRGTCRNGHTIRLELLETTLLSALAANLADTGRREELVAQLKNEIKEASAKRLRMADEVVSKRAGLVSEKTVLVKKADNLADDMEETGISRTLKAHLLVIEKRIAAIEEELSMEAAPVMPEFTDNEIRSFVEDQSRNFAEVLAADPQRAKEEIRKRVSQLTLTPNVSDDGCIYLVTGDVALFAPEDVMQSKGLESFGLHYTFPLRLEIEASRQFKRRIPSTVPAITHAIRELPVPDALHGESHHDAALVASPDATQPVSDESVPAGLALPAEAYAPTPALSVPVSVPNLLPAST